MPGCRVEKIKLVIFRECGTSCANANGAYGGTATLCNPRWLLGKVVFTSPNHIATRFTSLSDGSSWIISNIYGPNGKNAIKMLGSCIINARMAFPNGKWILLGDFNTPLSSMEKADGMLVLEESREDLVDMINSLCLLDLNLLGAKFTCSNRRSGGGLIQVRLDRGIISPEWIHNASCRLNVLSRIGSNHFPIFLSISPLTGRKAFPLRFEKMWLLALDIYDNISKWWNVDIQGTAMFRVANKLANIISNIQLWNKVSFSNIFQIKENLKKYLDDVQSQIQDVGYDPMVMDKQVELLTKIHDIISKEEEFWNQRSKDLWLKSGHKNMKFFHMTILKHRASNTINKILVDHGWIDKHEELN